MKVITEAILRDELRASEPEAYSIPEGKILSPAAREYLQQRKIKILKPGEKLEEKAQVQPTQAKEEVVENIAQKPKFVDALTGAFYITKPEHMTHLVGNILVPKNHPRILFRGKLDSLQAQVVFAQSVIAEEKGSEKLLHDLSDVLRVMREIMRCDVLDDELKNDTIIGFTLDEIHQRSHDPMRFFNIKQMTLPDYSMGKHYALLNQIRTAIRETEVSAAEAFNDGGKYTRSDIIEELNRLSSTLHIMMCMYLAGEYK